MNDWRDELPPIPAERIRAHVILEGSRRREREHAQHRAGQFVKRRRHRANPRSPRLRNDGPADGLDR
jgi:hypothetical protein